MFPWHYHNPYQFLVKVKYGPLFVLLDDQTLAAIGVIKSRNLDGNKKNNNNKVKCQSNCSKNIEHAKRTQCQPLEVVTNT